MNTHNDHTETELLNLYRENSSLRDQISEADVMTMDKVRAITKAIDDLHQLIARNRPSIEVACALDQVIADLEDSIE